MGSGPGLCQVHRIARYREPCRNDVAEHFNHADLAVALDIQHTVVVPISDQETAAVRFYRVLDTRVNEERSTRRVTQGECADVGDDGKAVWSIHSVNPDHAGAADIWANERDE